MERVAPTRARPSAQESKDGIESLDADAIMERLTPGDQRTSQDPYCGIRREGHIECIHYGFEKEGDLHVQNLPRSDVSSSLPTRDTLPQ